MSVNNSDYEIKIATAADVAGVEKAQASLAALQGQLKQLESEMALAQRTGVVVPKEALDQVDKLNNSIASFGKAVQTEGVTHKEIHEGFRLIGVAAGEALGPLGELAHFMANPYLLAAFGAVAAIKMLVEQHEKMREEMRKGVETSVDFREGLERNFSAAITHAREETAAFRREMERAGEEQNQFAARMAEMNRIIEATASQTRSLVSALADLISANIEAARLSGLATGPQAADAERHNRERERQQQEQSLHEQHEQTLQTERQQAAEARANAEALQHEAESPERTARRVANEAAVKDQQDEVDRRKKNLEDARTAAVNAGLGSDDLTEEGLRKKKAALAEANARAMRTDLPEGEAGAAAGRASGLTQDIEKIEQYRAKLGEVATAEKHLSEVTISAQDYEEKTKRLQDQAAEQKRFAEETERTANAQQRLNEIEEHGLHQRNQVQNETDRQRRLNHLLQQGETGQLTPDEAAEEQGATSTNPRGDISSIRSRIDAIQRNVQIFEGGHASAQETAELTQLMDRLIGLMENSRTTPAQLVEIERMKGRVNELERNVNNLQALHDAHGVNQ